MTIFGFLVIFWFAFLFSSLQGEISPSSGTNITFLPDGKIKKIQWTFGSASPAIRNWFFTRRGSSTREPLGLGGIAGATTITVINSSLPEVDIELPATLILNNVDERYNGKYEFEFGTLIGGGESYVNVYIAAKPTVTFNCPDTNTLNEGDDFSCVCKGEGGNPPADVTWFKDDKKIGGTGRREQMLTLRNIANTDRGTYTCLAESYPAKSYRDRKTLGIVVHFRPRKTNITFSQRKAEIGEQINITCESEGLPEPRFIITHNDTVVIAEKAYNIPQVKWSDSGSYQCIATNEVGSNSKSLCLDVLGAEDTEDSKKVVCGMGDDVVVWHIVVSVFSGVVIGCLFSYIVAFSCHKFRSVKPRQSNPEPSKLQVDKTYQELDLKKMYTEDNYQSLQTTTNQSTKNDDGNQDDSNYTELSDTREVENSYQSLT